MRDITIKDIPKKFYHIDCDSHPVEAFNVGELRAILEELPDKLPIIQGLSVCGGCKVVVYNADSQERYLELEEIYDEEDL